jgi:hypothetical protein
LSKAVLTIFRTACLENNAETDVKKGGATSVGRLMPGIVMP